MAYYFSSRTFRAKASIAWGKHGTLRFPNTGSTQYPVTLESNPFKPGAFVNSSDIKLPAVIRPGCQYPVVVDKKYGQSPSASTTHTVTIGTTQALSRLLVFLGRPSTGGWGATPAGWNVVTDGGFSDVLRIYWRDCDGTEGTTVDFTTGSSHRASWVVYKIAKDTFDFGVAPQMSNTSSTNGSGSTADEVDPTWAVTETLYITLTCLNATSARTVTSYPGNYRDNRNQISDNISIVYAGGNDSTNIALAGRHDTVQPSAFGGSFTLSGNTDYDDTTVAIKGICPPQPPRALNTNVIQPMSALRLVGSSSGETVGTSTTHSITMPSGVGGTVVFIYHAALGGTGSFATDGWVKFSDVGVVGAAGIEAFISHANPSGVLTFTTTTAIRTAWVAYRFIGADTAVLPEQNTRTTANSTAPDAGSITPTWSTAFETAYIGFCAGIDTTQNVNAFPANAPDGRIYVENTAALGGQWIGSSIKQDSSGSFDQDAYTLGSTDDWIALTFAVKASVATGVSVGIRTTFKPTNYANTSTIFAHTVNVSVGAVFKNPPLYTNTSTIFNASIRRTLRPTNYVDPDTINSTSIRRTLRPTNYVDPVTINSQSIRRTLRPTNLVDPDTINSQSIRRIMRPSLYTDPDVINSLSIRRIMRPALYSDADTFYTQVVRRTIRPNAHTNSNVIQSASLRMTLKPSLYSDGDTFFNATIIAGANNKAPTLHTNTNSFFSPKILTRLRPSVHVNNQTYYTQTLRRTLRPTNLVDPDTFYTQSIRRTMRPSVFPNVNTFYTHTLRKTLRPTNYTDPDTFYTQSLRRILRPTNYVDPDTINSQAIRRTLRPTNYTDPDTFYTHTLRRTINPTNYSDPDTINGQSIRRIMRPTNLVNSQGFLSLSITRTLKPSLYSDADTFYTQTVRATQILLAGLHTNSSLFYSARLTLTFTPALHSNDSVFPVTNVYVDLGQIWIEQGNPADPGWAGVADPAAPTWVAVGNPSDPGWSNVNDVISNWTEVPNGPSVTWSEND